MKRLKYVAVIAPLLFFLTACNAEPSLQNESEVVAAKQINADTVGGDWHLNGASTSAEGTYNPGTETVISFGPSTTFALRGPCHTITGDLVANENPMRVDNLIEEPVKCGADDAENANRVLGVFETLYGATLTETEVLQLLGTEGALTFAR